MPSAYHAISTLISAKQAPTEYMSGGGTHLTDYDPESKEYGNARYERRHGEAPSKETVDGWVDMHNSGTQTLDIAKGSGYPFHTIYNEIAKHPKGRASVLTTIRLTEDMAGRVDTARGGEPISKFLLKLLETAISDPGYAKAAGVNPTKADAGRWLRMRERGLSNSQIAEAVGKHPRYISEAIGPSRSKTKRTKTKKGPKKVSVRMPLWLKNMLDAAAEAAGITRAKLQQTLIGRGLERTLA